MSRRFTGLVKEKTLQELIESFGGVVVETDTERYGKVRVLLHYEDILLVLMEEQRCLLYDGTHIYLLQPKRDHLYH